MDMISLCQMPITMRVHKIRKCAVITLLITIIIILLWRIHEVTDIENGRTHGVVNLVKRPSQKTSPLTVDAPQGRVFKDHSDENTRNAFYDGNNQKYQRVMLKESGSDQNEQIKQRISVHRKDQQALVLGSIHSRMTKDKTLRNVREAFKKLGYNISQSMSADVFWLKYPIHEQVPTALAKLPPNRIFNHIPGMRPLIVKGILLTDPQISVILKAFALPKDKMKLFQYARKNRDTLWISKNFKHRGVMIKPIEEILSRDFKPSLIQEYLPNPLLIDNRKFDIGVFATVTSLSPLRMYIYTDDFLFKFCSKDYLPFDPKVKDKYVESHPITRLWELPSFMNTSFTGRKFLDILSSYLDNHGHDGQKLFDNILHAAKDVVNHREPYLAKDANHWIRESFFRRTFEFLRFDMVADDNINVWVNEINLSPDTETSSPTSLHKELFKRVLASSMVMGGLTNASWSSSEHAEMLDETTVSDPDIFVDDERCKICSEEDCFKQWKCRTCKLCLTSDDIYHMRKAVLEHRRQAQGPWVRVSPPPFRNQTSAKAWTPNTDKYYKVFSNSTKFLALWYHQKCLFISSWC